MTEASDPPVEKYCPPVIEYTAEFMAQAADEMDLIIACRRNSPGPCSAMKTLIEDYGQTRVELRSACEMKFGRWVVK